MINKIKVYTKSRNVYAEKDVLGISGENDVETLEFVLDSAVEGEAYIELEKLDTSGEKQRYFIKLDKKDDSYVLKVKSSLLDVIQDIKMQLVIRRGDNQVFKSKEFEMQVLTAINATSTIPEQYPTWIEQLEQKIQEIDDKLAETTQLEELLTRSETARQEQEESRVETEKLRVEAEEKREQNTAKAINDIKDLKDDYDENAETKIKEYNNNSADKISEFNKNAKDSTTAFNTNVTKKTATFDERVLEATKTFNSNVTNKTEDFNSNSNTKIQEFNDNSVEKLQEFNNNAKVKKDEYDKNAANKLNEYNKNAEDLISKVEQLQTENNELSSNMPWSATSGKSLHITDSAKYSKNKLEISGDMKQENGSGKNSFNINDKKTVDEVYTVDDEGWITCEYDNSEGTDIKYLRYYTNNLKLKTNTQYAIFVEIKNASGTGRLSPISYYTDSQFVKTFDIYFSDLKPDDIYKFVVGTKDNFSQSLYGLRTLCIFQPGKSGSITFRISVLEDTSVTTDNFKYEKYGAMPSTEFPSMPVVCTGVQKIRQFGENWFNKNNISKINAVVDISSIVANSSGKTFYIKIEPGTYTVSRKVIGARFVVGTTANIPKVGETIIDRMVNNNGSSITLTTSKNANYLVVYYLYNSSENEQEILDSIQIERGPKATKCKSYIEEINTLDLGTTKLCAIKDINGNVVAQDRIVYKDNKWQFKKNVAIHTIDKTALKQTSTSTNGKYRYQYFQIENNVVTAKDKNPGVCNIFSLARNGQTYECEKGFTAITGVWNFYDEGETLEEFITKTENVDIVVTYITKEPIYEYCTAEQSAILDKLYNNFTLQKGTNNIIVETDNGVGVNMQLEYMQDLQTKLNLLEAMCVSNAGQEV